MKRIPVCEPYLWENEKRYVMDALDTGWISSAGKYLNEFEKSFAAYCGVKHGVAVANGTVALHLALLAAGVGEGDEVILGDFTMAAPALAVLYCGAKPVLVDADPDTWCMRADLIEAKITAKTKAIIAVHIYGHPCDMDAINAVAAKHGLKVIEDAAEAHGATANGKRCGSLSHLSCFSFYANKIVTTGEGGMILTADDAMAEHLRAHRNLCFGPGLQRYLHVDIGYNYRLTNIQAALGLAQVEHIDEAIEKKRRIGRRYNELLAGISGLRLPSEKSWATNVYWVYGIVVGPGYGLSRDQLYGKLAEMGIETRTFFAGMHLQPFLIAHLKGEEQFPVSKNLGENGLYLPSYMHLTDEDQDRVALAVRSLGRGAQ